MQENFETEFFERIEQACETKARNFSEHIYYALQPNLSTEKADIARFEQFLEKLENKEQKGESTNRLIKWIKDSV